MNIDLVLLLKLFGEVIHESFVKVAPSEMPVVCRRLDGKLALFEFNNRARIGAVSNVDEANAPGFLFRCWEVELCDPIP